MSEVNKEESTYWARRVRVFEEWTCPKCDDSHLEERDDPQFRIREKTCPSCGFTKQC